MWLITVVPGRRCIMVNSVGLCPWDWVYLSIYNEYCDSLCVCDFFSAVFSSIFVTITITVSGVNFPNKFSNTMYHEYAY